MSYTRYAMPIVVLWTGAHHEAHARLTHCYYFGMHPDGRRYQALAVYNDRCIRVHVIRNRTQSDSPIRCVVVFIGKYGFRLFEYQN